MPESTFSWISPKLEVRDTGKYGNGLFTRENIRKNELLSVFGGHVMTRKEAEQLPEDLQDSGMQISEGLVLSARNRAELTASDFINHSCSPNAGFKGQIFMVAMKKIGGGREITFDYGMVLYLGKGVKLYKLDCNCGAKNCRRIITDNDWKLPDLQNRYDGYFQWFLQEKINLIKKNRYRSSS